MRYLLTLACVLVAVVWIGWQARSHRCTPGDWLGHAKTLYACSASRQWKWIGGTGADSLESFDALDRRVDAIASQP